MIACAGRLSPGLPRGRCGSTPPPDAGTADASSSPEAGPASVDGNFALVPCPAEPPTGACSIEGFDCPYSTQGCTCTNGSWDCRPCPATQPATGTTCPAQADGYSPAAFSCGYGNVTCSCVPNPNDGSDPPTWACGVCPVPAGPDRRAATRRLRALMPISNATATGELGCATGGIGSAPGSRNNLVPQFCAGFYACDYPTLDQSCTCRTPDVASPPTSISSARARQRRP